MGKYVLSAREGLWAGSESLRGRDLRCRMFVFKWGGVGQALSCMFESYLRGGHFERLNLEWF